MTNDKAGNGSTFSFVICLFGLLHLSFLISGLAFQHLVLCLLGLQHVPNETSSHPRGRKEANLKKLVTLTLRPLSLPINTHDFKTL